MDVGWAKYSEGRIDIEILKVDGITELRSDYLGQLYII
jgi:hypothetical protein